MVKEMIIKKIESGKQLGISKKIEKNGKLFWYEYAIQKVKKFITYMNVKLRRKKWQLMNMSTSMNTNILLLLR